MSHHPQQAQSTKCSQLEYDPKNYPCSASVGERRKGLDYYSWHRWKSLLCWWGCSKHYWNKKPTYKHTVKWFLSGRISAELPDINIADTIHSFNWWNNHGWRCWFVCTWILQSLVWQNTFCNARNSNWICSWGKKDQSVIVTSNTSKTSRFRLVVHIFFLDWLANLVYFLHWQVIVWKVKKSVPQILLSYTFEVDFQVPMFITPAFPLML